MNEGGKHVMDTFADYVLEEEDLASKMEIVYYLSKKTKIFFDKSVIFKTELLRMFLNYSKVQVDNNLILTASLLCNCRKIDNAQDLEKIHSYAKEGANYLRGLGFSKCFCKICEEINRYSNSNPREKESDILELVDQFGGMLLDRPERIGFKPDEALVLLEHRNLKDEYNRYLGTFIDFVNYLEQIYIEEITSMTALRRLVKIYNDTEELTKFIQKVIYDYQPKIDELMEEKNDEIANEILEENCEENQKNKTKNPTRALFSEETTKKILANIKEEKMTVNNTSIND